MTWKVYGVIDPGANQVVYVGISRDVTRRLRFHENDRSSAIYEYLGWLRQTGQKPGTCIFGQFGSCEAALLVEGRLISTLPQVYNRTHEREGEEFYATFRHLERAACMEPADVFP